MNPILTIREMQQLEECAFVEGVDAWTLMQQAAEKMTGAIRQFYPHPGRCRIYAGKGNNGGDAFVVARLLLELGWEIDLVCPFSPEELSPLCKKARKEWRKGKSGKTSDTRNRRQPPLVIDGLLGIGVKGKIRPPLDDLIQQINHERKNGAVVFSLDLPSGLGTSLTVVADHTLTVGFAKDVLLTDKATDFVGRISVLALEDLQSTKATFDTVAIAGELRSLLPPRTFDQHKGMAGRVAIVAGSLGTAGAAVLAANGCLRAGAGLVSLFCPPEIYPLLAPMLPPEVMARPWGNPVDLASENFDVIAIGPGLSREYTDLILPLIHAAKGPLVLDAGALAMVTPKLLDTLETPILITPHPGEMQRLFPARNRSRAKWARQFCDQHRPTLLLKGARTVISERDKPLSYNTTGHPGMATGGMGDTLTGVCAALIGHKLTPFDAARIGAWVCGRAAEIALLEHSESQESLLPTSLAACLGKAFADLRLGVD